MRLTKHHGAGNDFLVLMDEDRRFPVGPALVRALADRHHGIGADGVIRVTPGADGAALAMELWNADGGAAEMSGNGIRCLAQAAVEAGAVAPGSFVVATAAGLRRVDYAAGRRAGEAEAWVDMGAARLGGTGPVPAGFDRSRLVEVGNPHLVLLGPDPAGVDVAALGAGLETTVPGGLNVEFVALGPGADALTLRVWERGVGETEACGTGSCAAAAAARDWELVGDEVVVHNPGGTLTVRLGPDGMQLGGPTRRVAEVEVDVDVLLEAEGA